MKRIFFLPLCVVLSLSVSAGVVDRATAKMKAMSFMPGKQFVESKSFISTRSQTPEKSNAFYVFNTEENQGFVIVSGDDRTQEILGYAEHGNLDDETMPENMRWWLENLARQIEALDSSLRPATKNATRSSMRPITPLIKTEWGQGSPYNHMCPDGNNIDYDDGRYTPSKRCVTGCVATAMAQVMYYWQWPNSCNGIGSYDMGYWDNKGTDDNPDLQFVKVCEVHSLPATTFNWELMKTKYKSGEYGEDADAVANLMRYCGQAVSMQYGTEESSSYLAPSIMGDYFNYSKNIRELSRDNYTTSQWESLVYNELIEGRPVLYAGFTSQQSGHTFIVDGYRSDGLFHMNWGWDSKGSYSVLSVCDYENEHGIVGSQNRNAYQFKQRALFGVKPGEEGEILRPVLYSYFEDFNTVDYTRTSTDVDFKKVKISAFVSGQYNMDPQSAIDVQIGWGLYQNDQLVSCITSERLNLPAEKNLYFENKQEVSFGANQKEGKYLLCQVYRFSDDEDWMRCEDHGIYSLVAEVSSTMLTIRKQQMSFKVNNIKIPEQIQVGKSCEVILNITNTGELPTVTLNMWTQKSGTSDWEKVAEEKVFINPNATDDVRICVRFIEAGHVAMKITDTSDNQLTLENITIAPSDIVIPAFCTYEGDEVCAFFEAPASWNNTIHCWAWTNDDNFTGGSWPGVSCEMVGTADNGNKVWKWTWNGWKQNGTATTQPEMIIFNNNPQPQTNDMVFTLHGYYNEEGFLGEVTTDIRNIPATIGFDDGKVYSLDGRLLRTDGSTNNITKGVYIINGKKKVVK